MITIRHSNERGFADHGWLQTHHTFSFANYYDPEYMGFRHLRVINEDVIAPVSGFDTHDHADMEILTWVIEGELTHKDSLGTQEILRANEAQVMSAGTGISHSERNNSRTSSVHLLQIWLEPQTIGRTPVYAQRHFPIEERQGKQQIIASPDGREGSLCIGQQTTISLIHLRASDQLQFAILPGRQMWIQVISAVCLLNGQRLEPGDGAAMSEELELNLHGTVIEGDVLIFELF